jgi:hypothetical protein
MTKLKRLWAPVLLGVLLMASLVGVANGRPKAAPRQQGWMVVSVPMSGCIGEKSNEALTYSRNYVTCMYSSCVMFCPVHFPAAGEQAVGAVNVRRVTMYALDTAGGVANEASFGLYKTYPPTGGAVQMADAGTVDSAADPQTVIDFTIDSPVVYRVNSPSLEAGFATLAAGSVRIYGFFIHYTWM